MKFHISLSKEFSLTYFRIFSAVVILDLLILRATSISEALVKCPLCLLGAASLCQLALIWQVFPGLSRNLGALSQAGGP